MKSSQRKAGVDEFKHHQVIHHYETTVYLNYRQQVNNQRTKEREYAEVRSSHPPTPCRKIRGPMQAQLRRTPSVPHSLGRCAHTNSFPNRATTGLISSPRVMNAPLMTESFVWPSTPTEPNRYLREASRLVSDSRT